MARKQASEATRRRVAAFMRTHEGLTPTQWEALQARGLGLTRYQFRKQRAAARRFQQEGQQGPLPRTQARVLGRLTVRQMHEANIAWSRSTGAELVERLEPATKGAPFNPGLGGSHRRNRQSLTMVANTYHEDIARDKPRYIVSFYNAIVNPDSNYWSNHQMSDTGPRPDLYGRKPMGQPAFREYLRDWLSVIQGVSADDIDAWYQDRYSMALLDM